MDDDDGLYLAENISGSNTDDDNEIIDSDLEDRLYAAVFHSNDIPSKNQETTDYNNITSLTDVIGSWKNIPDQIQKTFSSSERIASTRFPQKSDDNIFGDKHYVEDSDSIKLTAFDERIDDRNESGYDEEKEISERGNRLEDSRTLDFNGKLMGDRQCAVNRETRDVIADKETEIDLYGEKETGPGLEMRSAQDTAEKQKKNVTGVRKRSFYPPPPLLLLSSVSSPEGKRSTGSKIMKRKNSPGKLSKSNDSTADSPLKSLRSDNIDCDAYSRAEIDSHNDSPILAAPENATESSEIKAEEEVERNEPVTERTVTSSDDRTCATIEGLDRRSSIKSEEEFEETVQTKEREIVEKKADEVADVKPEEEQVEKAGSMDNRSSTSSSSSSSSDSSSEDSSSSSSSNQNTQDIQDNEEADKTQHIENEGNETITLDDSEGSICEVPVPPKPMPLVIDLEDSQSSLSSDSDAATEIMTPEKLVHSYKNAVSKSKSNTQGSEDRGDSTPQNKRGLSTGTSSLTTESDDSMTQSEEENWGIIAGSQIYRAKPTTSSSTNFTISEIEHQDSNGSNMEHGDKSNDFVLEERVNSISESQRETLTVSTEIILEKQTSEDERLSHSRQKSAENNDKEKELENNENMAEDDTLIINAEIAKGLSDLEEIREAEIPPRTPENRKRSINDSGKKSKHQNSPKKAKSSNELASIPGHSGNNKSRKENVENQDKERNCAADYFFTPMNKEMENYYNKSWGGENFDIDTIRRQMPRDPRNWAVLNEDLLGCQQRRSRYWIESKCRNCNHTGHHVAECPEKRKVPSCHMCGTPGHREPRCPHKMCLGCGRKQKTYMQVCNGCRRAWCNGCESYGHFEDKCPDLWRRYHVTTNHKEVNTHLNVNKVMKPSHLLSCCNCAKRGHDSTNCENYRWSRHFPTPSYVTNYTTGPAYVEEEPVPEDLRVEAREQTEIEKSNLDGSAIASTSINEGRKRKANVDEAIEENLHAEEILESGSKEADENVVIVEERPKEQSKPNQEKTLKITNEVILTNYKSKKNGEILFTLKSKLLDNNFTRLANFGECKLPLFPKQCEELVDSDSSRQFLLNLTSQFPMKIEIKRSRIGEITMYIASTRDLHLPIQTTITDWLKRPIDERNRFVSLNLPTSKDDLVKLLSDKLSELDHNLGNPHALYADIVSMKRELARLQNQSKAGTKMSTSSKRARIVERLANSQCRLNMILFGQVKTKKTMKSCKFLRNALNVLQKADSGSFICAATYLLLVHHYNIVFSAYTPDRLSELLKSCCPKPGKKKANQTPKKQKALNAKSPQKRNTESPLLVDLISPSNTRDRVSGIHRNEDCSGVENQFIVPETSFNNANYNVSPARIPSSSNLDLVDKNCNNSQNDFQGNPSPRWNSGEVQKNRQQDDYIALDNRGSSNELYNAERDRNIFGGGGDSNRKSKGRYMEKNGSRDRTTKGTIETENGFHNNPRTNYTVENNSTLGKNRWQEGYATQHSVTSQDMFYSDTQSAGSSKKSPHNDTTVDNLSRINIERRNRQSENVPSTSGIGNNNQSIIHSDNNQSQSIAQGKIANKNKKKRKRLRGGKLPPYLQKRVAKNIAKYLDVGCSHVTQAAQALQKKLSDKELTLQCVIKFEGLVKKRLKKTDYLL